MGQQEITRNWIAESASELESLIPIRGREGAARGLTLPNESDNSTRRDTDAHQHAHLHQCTYYTDPLSTLSNTLFVAFSDFFGAGLAFARNHDIVLSAAVALTRQ